jgi:NADPH-dependent 2,4-dienoyl-CoA reductase/sulfur reductase-like enzyme
VITSGDALSADVGAEVVVLDRLGDMEASLVAEALIKRGVSVTFVTPLETFAPRAGFMQVLDLKPIFRDAGCEVLTETDVESVDGGALRLIDRHGRARGELKADTVVAVTAPEPDLSLAPALDALAIPYRVVGDALAPLGVRAAIRDGDRVGKAI